MPPPRVILSAVVCLSLLGWAAWIRIPGPIVGVYLAALPLLALTWGVSFERSFGRAMGGTMTGAMAATVVAFLGMFFPNAELERRCSEPDMHCEDFSGAILLYGAPFFLLGAALLGAAVHAAALGIGRGVRHLGAAR